MGRRKTLNEFLKEVKNLVGSEYTVLSNEYINNKTKILMKHNKCGHEYLVTPDKFLQGRRCPNCNGPIHNLNNHNNSIKYTTESFKEKMNKISNNEYLLLSEYINTNTKVKLKHKKCNNVFEMTPNHFLNSNERCPYCSKNIKTTKTFKKEVYNLVGNEYEVLGEYINNKTKILMKHNKCGHEFNIRPKDFTSEYSKTRCPYCRYSKMEEFISDYLDNELNIKFFREYKIPDCKYKQPLPFDFAIPSENNDFLWLIEYDGEYHFKEIKRCNDKSINKNNFKLTKIRDSIKNDYCNNKDNLKLLRLNYKMSKDEIKDKIYKFLYLD